MQWGVRARRSLGIRGSPDADFLGALGLRQVFSTLKEAQFYAKRSKCYFFRQEIEFLGYIISREGVKMAAEKIQAIVSWPDLTNASDVRSFLGLAGWYRNFIRSFAHISGFLGFDSQMFDPTT